MTRPHDVGTHREGAIRAVGKICTLAAESETESLVVDLKWIFEVVWPRRKERHDIHVFSAREFAQRANLVAAVSRDSAFVENSDPEIQNPQCFCPASYASKVMMQFCSRTGSRTVGVRRTYPDDSSSATGSPPETPRHPGLSSMMKNRGYNSRPTCAR